MQWNHDFAEHKAKPTINVPGVEYMLAGATQRSDSDPFDKTDPPIRIGPHWMILWPFNPKTTGLPTTHKPTGAYIMWAGTPWAHVQVWAHLNIYPCCCSQRSRQDSKRRNLWQLQLQSER